MTAKQRIARFEVRLTIDRPLEYGANRFCGPGALSILSGQPSDECSRVIRSVTGKRSVFGVKFNDLLRAGRLLGLHFQSVADYIGNHNKPSLERLASDISPLWGPIHLVFITGHYCVLNRTADGWEVCDNLTVYPLPLSRYRFRAKHVKAAWEVRHDC